MLYLCTRCGLPIKLDAIYVRAGGPRELPKYTLARDRIILEPCANQRRRQFISLGRHTRTPSHKLSKVARTAGDKTDPRRSTVAV
jgi:hypothetical protein